MSRLGLGVLAVSLVVSCEGRDFPMFKQCDARWGNDTMGAVGDGERDTICHQGCAMSSLAMAISGYGFVLPDGKDVTPGSLNDWLIQNHGYRCMENNCNNLVLDAADALTGGFVRLIGEWGGPCCGGAQAKPSLDQMRQLLDPAGDQHVMIIAHVRNNSHFVLLTAWNDGSKSFDVKDPGFDEVAYDFESISDVIMYSVIPTDAYVPMRYPLFKQYDYQWKDDLMVSKTIGEVGCLMSSTSMALRANRIGVDVNQSNPQSLNRWLRTNGGYDDDNDMSEESIPDIAPGLIQWSDKNGMHRSNDVRIASVATSLSLSQPVIANVMNGRHFVLVVGMSFPKDGDLDANETTTLYVNDPGFYRNTYDFKSDVVGWRFFNMTMNRTSVYEKERSFLETSRNVLRL